MYTIYYVYIEPGAFNLGYDLEFQTRQKVEDEYSLVLIVSDIDSVSGFQQFSINFKTPVRRWEHFFLNYEFNVSANTAFEEPQF